MDTTVPKKPCCESNIVPGVGFSEAFSALAHHKPYAWQKRLFNEFCAGRIPRVLDLPTGTGKSSVMLLWLLSRAAGARVPRRLVYVVDRRAIVDQATSIALRLAEELSPGACGIPVQLRRALRIRDGKTLAVSTLRGQLADNRAWLEDPTDTAIVTGTVDMIGSRLLFQGFGVSRRMRPYHAALLGTDALLILDEEHISPAFDALLSTIIESPGLRSPAPIPPRHAMSLSATTRHALGDTFCLTEAESAQPEIARRLDAEKILHFKFVEKASLRRALYECAVARGANAARVIVYCDSRQTASDVAGVIENVYPGAVEQLVGARRVRERSALSASSVYRRFETPNDGGDGAAFLVATAAGEVGVDLYADHLVCDLVPFERMIQRLGRVNRAGFAYTARVDVLVDSVLEEARSGEEDLMRTDDLARIAQCLDLLRRLPLAAEGLNASPRNLRALAESDPSSASAASSPEPSRPELNLAVVEAWSMTTLRNHPGRPHPEPWIRGWAQEEPQSRIAWRELLPWRDGGAEPEEIEDFFEAAPINLNEVLEAPAWLVLNVLMERAIRVSRGGTLPNSALAAIVLAGDNSLGALLRIGDLVGAKTLRGNDGKRQRDAITKQLVGNTVVANRGLGGLGSRGLLDESANGETLETLDVGWSDEELSAIGYRVVKRGPNDKWEDEDWRAGYTFTPASGDEADTSEVYVVQELRRKAVTVSGNLAVSRFDQKLSEHLDWAGGEARIMAALLPETYALALEIAAKLHDTGKAREAWQAFAGNNAVSIPLAKFKSRPNPKRLRIGSYTYRHEFGSLADAEVREEPKRFSQEVRDLILHLIGAHHGRCRPEIDPADPQFPPSSCRVRAREAALRFSRLQQYWKPWGLAWLEAMLQGADWRASQLLDDGNA